MSAHLASVPIPPSAHVVDGDQSSPTAELATAAYAEREIDNACATAELCHAVATRAHAEGRHLVAGVLGEFGAQFSAEASLLAPASMPDIRWPRRSVSRLDVEADLDGWIETVDESLQYSERTLRWIAGRPDLPTLARVTFDALATARHARRHLLLACTALDA